MSSTVQGAMVSLENLLTYLQSYEQYDFLNAIQKAKEMAGLIAIEPQFDQNKRQIESRQYRTSFEAFKTDFVLHIIEVATESANDRFEAMKEYDLLFSFLYDFQNFEINKASGKLNESCMRLACALTQNENADIDGEDLCREFPIVATLVKNENITHAIDILNLIKKYDMENLVPNMVIAYRIMLSMPVSVASGERTFSKLKIIKTYLRNSMNQDRLNSLAIVSIENDVAESIDYDVIIDEFASMKARKRKLN